MYTEYVFENKSYEVALRNIKSILFDVVAQEEKNIEILRDKAFAEVPAPNAEAMQALFIQQDEKLRRVLEISDQLKTSLQEVDSCSKRLHEIEQGNVLQPVAVQQEQPVAALQMAVEDTKADAPQIVPTNMSDIADAIAVDEGDSVAREEAEQVDNGISTMTDDIIAAHPEKTEADPVIEFSDNPVITNPVIPVEATAEDSPEGESSEEKKEDLIFKYNDEVSTIEAAPEPTEEEKPAEGAAEGETTEEKKEDLIFKYNDEVSTIEAAPEPTEEKPAEGAAEGEATEEKKEDLIFKYNDEVSTIEAAPEPEAEETQEAATAEAPADAPVEPVLTPIEENQAAAGADSGKVIIFRKRGDDSPRGIMISKEQSMKLKASESTQAALLSAKGVLQSSYSGEKQLEAMMEEANALYAEGKVAEAQDKIDEISIYSKGMTKSMEIAA